MFTIDDKPVKPRSSNNIGAKSTPNSHPQADLGLFELQ
jgi:hypothetical protein